MASWRRRARRLPRRRKINGCHSIIIYLCCRPMSDTAPADTAPDAPFRRFGETEVAPRTRFQKVVARTMVDNATRIPHVTHHDEVDVTALEAHRKTLAA